MVNVDPSPEDIWNITFQRFKQFEHINICTSNKMYIFVKCISTKENTLTIVIVFTYNVFTPLSHISCIQILFHSYVCVVYRKYFDNLIISEFEQLVAFFVVFLRMCYKNIYDSNVCLYIVICIQKINEKCYYYYDTMIFLFI